MTANILHDDRDRNLDLAFKQEKNLEWVVRENPKLQAELNKLDKNGEEISSKVVNKVLDRIKDL